MFEVEGAPIDTRPGAHQDARGVDLTLVDRTLAMTSDERVKRLDTVLNSAHRLRGLVGVLR